MSPARLPLLVAAISLLAELTLAQSVDTALPIGRALGGTAIVRFRGELFETEASERSQQVGVRPYFLSVPDAEGKQTVTQVGIGFDRFASTSPGQVEVTRRRTDVNLGVTRGQRIPLFRRDRLFAAVEYGLGPSFTLTATSERFGASTDDEATEYGVGVIGYAEVVVGYRVAPRLRVVADVLNAGVNATAFFAEGEGLSAYNVSAQALQGIGFGVEWALVVKARE